jgi:hypothetical protein
MAHGAAAFNNHPTRYATVLSLKLKNIIVLFIYLYSKARRIVDALLNKRRTIITPRRPY